MRKILRDTLAALASESRPRDSYVLARKTGHSPMDTCRALQELAALGKARGLADGGDNAVGEQYECVA